jgi:hypothetical protein
MSGLGVVKPKRLEKGKGVMSSLLKAVASAIIDAASNAGKGKVEGMGRKRKGGRLEVVELYFPLVITVQVIKPIIIIIYFF